MHISRTIDALKSGVTIFASCLLLVACSTNTTVQTAQNEESWVQCHASGTGQGWDCTKGRSRRDVSPIQMQNENPEVITAPVAHNYDEQVSSQAPTPVSQTVSDTEKPEIFETPKASTIPASDLAETARANYSIQLAAFLTAERRETFIQALSINRSELKLVQAQRSDQTWWLVLYGEYREYAEAVDAQAELIQNHGLSETWIKPLD